MTSNWKAK